MDSDTLSLMRLALQGDYPLAVRRIKAMPKSQAIQATARLMAGLLDCNRVQLLQALGLTREEA